MARSHAGQEDEKLDRGQMGIGLTRPPEAPEVEVQAWTTKHVVCPWCNADNWIEYDPDRYHWYICGSCGRPYQA